MKVMSGRYAPSASAAAQTSMAAEAQSDGVRRSTSDAGRVTAHLCAL